MQPKASSELEPRLFALRHGPIELANDDDDIVLVLDGLLLPVIEDRPRLTDALFFAPERAPRTNIFASRFDERITAITGDLVSGPALVSSSFAQGYYSSIVGVETLEFDGNRWRRVADERGDWTPAYAAIVERGDAVFGLRRWGLNLRRPSFRFDVHSREGRDGIKDVVQEGAPAPEFVWISAPAGPLPELPDRGELLVHTAAVTNAGELLVLLEDEGCKLVRWPAGDPTARIAALPEFDDSRCGVGTQVRAQRDVALIFGHAGHRPYLATAHAGGVRAVALADLPELPLDSENEDRWITAAASTPAGEWWLLGNAGLLDVDTVDPEVEARGAWRRRAGADTWEQVRFPAVPLSGQSEWRWIYDSKSSSWTHQPPHERHSVEPHIIDLRWGSGALWITVRFEPVATTHSSARYGLFTSLPGDEVIELPDSERMAIEPTRASIETCEGSMRPIDPQRFLLVLVSDLDAEPQLRDQFDLRWSALAEAAVQRSGNHWAVMTHVFVGRRLGRRALVAEAQASNVEARNALIDAVGKALGATPVAECGSADLLESVGFPAARP